MYGSKIVIHETQFKVARVLNARRGCWITMKEIVDDVYGDDEDGGPLDAKSVVRQTIHRLKRKGWPIVNNLRGYSLLEGWTP